VVLAGPGRRREPFAFIKEVREMKRTIVFMLAGLFAATLLCVFSAPTDAVAGPIRLSYANFPPAPTFPCVQMERWKKEVEERTGGKVAIDTYPGGTLLDAKNMMDGVIAGQADIGCLCMAYQPGRFIVTNATALPLGFPDAESATLALWSLYQKYQPDEFRKVKVLAMFACAPANIYAKKKVANLEDLRGLELRASGGVAEVLKALGATPVGMPQSEAPEALQKGVVQGAASSLETLMDFKYAEMCRYVTIFNGPVYPFSVVMNQRIWDSLPKDVQKVMDDLRLEQSEWTGKYMDEHVNESIEWSKENYDIEITRLSAEEKARWDEKLVPMISKWIEHAESKDIPGGEIVAYLKGFVEK
jgi:TRAP-type C4-dicarboxylate transport system substrate-binding protein